MRDDPNNRKGLLGGGGYLALKRARIVDFCCKPSGFVAFENTVDRESAVNFGADCLLCLYWGSVGILGAKRTLDHRSFFSLGQYVDEFIQIISFFFQTKLI